MHRSLCCIVFPLAVKRIELQSWRNTFGLPDIVFYLAFVLSTCFQARLVLFMCLPTRGLCLKTRLSSCYAAYSVRAVLVGQGSFFQLRCIFWRFRWMGEVQGCQKSYFFPRSRHILPKHDDFPSHFIIWILHWMCWVTCFLGRLRTALLVFDLLGLCFNFWNLATNFVPWNWEICWLFSARGGAKFSTYMQDTKITKPQPP